MRKEYLEAGQIVNTHGIKGEVKILPLCDSPEILCEFDRFFMGNLHKEIFVKSSRVHKNVVIAKIDGINTPEEAAKLRNTVLYMHRDDLELPEDTYFIDDLIGMTVKDADTGFVYGNIVDVLQTGANDVYSIKGDRNYLVPAIPDVVIETDVAGNVMKIRPLEGLFDEQD